MATAAILARGTKLQRETTPASGTFTDIPERKDISWPNPTSAEVDVTNQDSAGRAKEFLIGEQDFGEVTANGNYIPGSAVLAQLITDRDANPPTQRTYRILLPGSVAPATTFTAFVSGYDRTGDVAGAAQDAVRLRVTGLPVEDATP